MVEKIPDDADLSEARKIVKALEERDSRLLTHLCTFICSKRALAKVYHMSPIISIDPISYDMAEFIERESPGISFPEALQILALVERAIVQDDVIASFMKYDRSMVL